MLTLALILAFIAVAALVVIATVEVKVLFFSVPATAVLSSEEVDPGSAKISDSVESRLDALAARLDKLTELLVSFLEESEKATVLPPPTTANVTIAPAKKPPIKKRPAPARKAVPKEAPAP